MISTNPMPPGIRKAGSVGVPCDAEMRVVNDHGIDMPPYEDGEIVIRGPSVIRAYGNATTDSSEYFFDDWLRTGDLGHVDSEAYYYITGRKKELIKRGGLSVYPSEVDNALAVDSRVAEAVTFSVPHPTLGEEVVSAVVPVNGLVVNEDELREPLFEKLSTYKIPAAILVVDHIPKSETGKVLRRELAVRFAQQLAPRNSNPDGETETKLLAIWREVLAARRHWRYRQSLSVRCRPAERRPSK